MRQPRIVLDRAHVDECRKAPRRPENPSRINLEFADAFDFVADSVSMRERVFASTESDIVEYDQRVVSVIVPAEEGVSDGELVKRLLVDEYLCQGLRIIESPCSRDAPIHCARIAGVPRKDPHDRVGGVDHAIRELNRAILPQRDLGRLGRTRRVPLVYENWHLMPRHGYAVAGDR